MIAILDYGIGNVGAIRNMFAKIGAQAKVTASPADLRAATKLVLPGIGAFDTGMRHLQASGLIPVLNQLVLEEGKTILGICLGMQLLARRSAEGAQEGLGWIKADCVRFDSTGPERLKVPHMRWNSVRAMPCSTLLDVGGEAPWFYFVHSYHVVCDNPTDVAGVTVYGNEFTSAVQCGHIYGVQFHPEKSLRYGKRLLEKFVELTGNA